MGMALLVSRLLLASVFAVSGVAKASDFSRTRRTVTDFGAPERASLPVALLLLVTELAIAVALLPSSTAHLGGVAAAALLVVFIAATALAISRGRAPGVPLLRQSPHFPCWLAHGCPQRRVPFPGVVYRYRRLGGERAAVPRHGLAV